MNKTIITQKRGLTIQMVQCLTSSFVKVNETSTLYLFSDSLTLKITYNNEANFLIE